MKHHEKVHRIAKEAYVYIPFNGEATCITQASEEDGCIYARGEETGNEYIFQYEDVDLEEDMFYKLTMLENE
jgi:hypothetical protein